METKAERKREANRKWRLNNPDYYKKYRCNRNLREPGFRREEWRKNNAKRREQEGYNERNRERVKAWRKANPLKRAAQAALRKARKYDNGYEYVDVKAVVDRDNGICYLCGMKPDKPTLDHVIPLSKGGAHTYSNIRLACLPCNMAKSDKLITEKETR